MFLFKKPKVQNCISIKGHDIETTISFDKITNFSYRKAEKKLVINFLFSSSEITSFEEASFNVFNSLYIAWKNSL